MGKVLVTTDERQRISSLTKRIKNMVGRVYEGYRSHECGQALDMLDELAAALAALPRAQAVSGRDIPEVSMSVAVHAAARAWHYAQPVYRTNWHGDREVIPFEELPHGSIKSRLDGMRAALEAALTALTPPSEAGDGWKDISTAPKDGSEFIYQSEGGAVSTCAWREDDCGFDWYDIHGDQIAYPIRWMRLPASIIAEERGPAPGGAGPDAKMPAEGWSKP